MCHVDSSEILRKNRLANQYSIYNERDNIAKIVKGHDVRTKTDGTVESIFMIVNSSAVFYDNSDTIKLWISQHIAGRNVMTNCRKQNKAASLTCIIYK